LEAARQAPVAARGTQPVPRRDRLVERGRVGRVVEGLDALAEPEARGHGVVVRRPDAVGLRLSTRQAAGLVEQSLARLVEAACDIVTGLDVPADVGPLLLQGPHLLAATDEVARGGEAL